MATEQRPVIPIADETDHGRIRPREVLDAIGLAAQGPTGISNRERTAARRAPAGAHAPVVQRDRRDRQACIEVRKPAPDRSQR